MIMFGWGIAGWLMIVTAVWMLTSRGWAIFAFGALNVMIHFSVDRQRIPKPQPPGSDE